jgi:hypothetical protein
MVSNFGLERALNELVAESAEILGLTGEELAVILRIPSSETKRRAMYLINIRLNLLEIMQDSEGPKRWLRSHNGALQAAPLDIMKDLDGLKRVEDYLDAQLLRNR